MTERDMIAKVEELCVWSLGMAQRSKGAKDSTQLSVYTRFARVLGRAVSDLEKVLEPTNQPGING